MKILLKKNQLQKEMIDMSYVRNYELEVNKYLSVHLTDEGVIIDVVENGEIIGTVGMMAHEWADHLTENN